MALRVVDTKEAAAKTFRTFHDRAPEEEIELPFTWPPRLQEVGEGKAEMYRSNKWKKNRSEHDDYKHVVESNRTVYVEPGFLREGVRPYRPMKLYGPTLSFEGTMPKYFTFLGPLLGVQLRLYDESETLPSGGKELYEVRIARAKLGAAKHPDTNETFLFVYTPDGVHMILTGERLSIEKDGIAG